jgi:hypothetical protein
VSFKATRIVWEHSKATGNARLVMLALADFATSDGLCWPSARQLGAVTLLTQGELRVAVSALGALGECEFDLDDPRRLVCQLTIGGLG